MNILARYRIYNNCIEKGERPRKCLPKEIHKLMSFYPKNPKANPEAFQRRVEKKRVERKLVMAVREISALHETEVINAQRKNRTKLWEDLAAQQFPGSK